MSQQREELAGKSVNELLAAILELSGEIKLLCVLNNDWEKVHPQIEKKMLRFQQLNFALRDRTKEPGDFLKWARAREADKETFSAVAYRKLREGEKVFEAAKTKSEEIVSGKKQLTEEEFQANIFLKIEEMIFHNFKNNTEAVIFSVQNSFYDNRFQAETTETMLKVKERLESSEQVQAKTAKILEKVAENTDKEGQFILIVAASALVAISVGLLGDIIFLKWKDEIKEHWVAATLSVIVIGVFAILAIKKWVFGKN